MKEKFLGEELVQGVAADRTADSVGVLADYLEETGHILSGQVRKIYEKILSETIADMVIVRICEVLTLFPQIETPPLYRHGCKDCVFLGRLSGAELYYCHFRGRFVVQFRLSEANYSTTTRSNRWARKAAKLAREKNLILEEVKTLN